MVTVFVRKLPLRHFLLEEKWSIYHLGLKPPLLTKVLDFIGKERDTHGCWSEGFSTE